MSSSSSSDKFNVQKWNEALLVASKLVAKQLIDNPDIYKEAPNSSGWDVSSGVKGIRICIIFACDITAPSGTYPTSEEPILNSTSYTFSMSRDIFFDHFALGATIVMRRFVAMVIKEYNTTQTKFEILMHSSFDTSRSTSDATNIWTHFYTKPKTAEVVQPGVLSWVFSPDKKAI